MNCFTVVNNLFLNVSWQRFLSLASVRLESGQQMTAKDKKIALPSEPLSKNEGKLKDVVSMRRQRYISS